jgi:glycosyltransferase involved in cell wall biosynthesis
MASNLPVVAPDDLSRKEIIGEAGILTDVFDIQKYSQSLNQALSFDWKEKPRVQAGKFSWERIAREYEELIAKMHI